MVIIYLHIGSIEPLQNLTNFHKKGKYHQLQRCLGGKDRGQQVRHRHMSRLFVITQFKRHQIRLWLLWCLCHLAPVEINGSLTTVVLTAG